ncbi:hypothetical protein AAG570_002448 [Ranatra chinensis]|uniref:Uncharacterized protein n=1 Tax=Ranatra chinensis TaxID=642074 RepID=A0ABD0Y7J8_9HEMI
MLLHKMLVRIGSVLRDLRHQRAELVQKELEQGLEKWQDDVMVTQWVATLRAEEQAIRELEARTQRLHEKNKIRQILHKHNLNKVKEMEDYKVENLRKQVQYKDLKISVLHNEREKVICESRNRAHSVAELRQQISWHKFQNPLVTILKRVNKAVGTQLFLDNDLDLAPDIPILDKKLLPILFAFFSIAVAE